MSGMVILLFVAAMLLILLEFILPGGVLGGIGALLVIASTALGCYYYPQLALFIVVGEILGTVACILLGVYILSRTSAGKSLVLADTQSLEDGFSNQASDTGLVGQRGIVLSALRPAGSIEVEGRRLDVIADGAFIEDGAEVVITEVNGNHIMVETVETPSAE